MATRAVEQRKQEMMGYVRFHRAYQIDVATGTINATHATTFQQNCSPSNADSKPSIVITASSKGIVHVCRKPRVADRVGFIPATPQAVGRHRDAQR